MSDGPEPRTTTDDARRHARVSELMLAALARPEPERRAWLEQSCADDPSLAAEVLSLLDHDADTTACLPAGDLLAHVPPEALAGGAHGAGDDGPDGATADVPPDARVPGYTLVRVVGQGGMGTVYEAEQHAPRRRVALKVLSGVGVAGEALRRFARESQILGQLQHPGICQVHEIGHTTSGEPFFAMELVDGRQLLQHADHAGLDRPRRLALACAVCDAVAHAHERGVVHRDLKPDNILVTAEGRPKVVDFGIARATEMTVASTLLTSAGAVVGTVAYMSPEQAAGETDVDVRADVFALGVVLFELLTGARPSQTTGLSLPQALHVIQRDDHSLAALAHADLDGDLRTILAKTLERDPARRYTDAGALAKDIRRHLTHQPIVARPPSLAYRVTKFTRRHRGLVVATLLVVASLLAGAMVALEQARRANRGEELAEQRAGEADRQAYRATMTAVLELIDAGRLRQAADEFALAPAGQRGWEADHVAAVLDQQFGRALWDGPAYEAALSPDGHQAFALGAGEDGRPVLLRFDLPDGTLRDRWPLDARPLAVPREALAFARTAAIQAHPEGLDVELIDAADGASLGRLRSGPSPLSRWEDARSRPVVTDAAGRVALLHGEQHSRLWDLLEGRPLGPDLHAGLSVELSPDGALVLTARNTQASVVDGRSGETIWRTPLGSDGSSSATFAADGRAVYTSGLILDPVVRKWSLDGGLPLAELPLEGCAGGDPWAVSADGRVVAIAPGRTRVVLFDGDLGHERRQLGLPPGDHARLALDADGDVLVAALGEGGLRLWDLNQPWARDVLEGHATYVYAVAFSPDGRRLASAGFGRRVLVWDVASGRQLAAFEGLGGWVDELAWSHDGRLICAAAGQQLTTLDGSTGEQLARLDLDGRVGALAMRPGHAELAVVTDDGMRLLDPASLDVVRELPRVNGAAWSQDGGLLATVNGDGDVVVRGADDLVERWRGSAPGPLGWVTFEPGGARVACFGPGGVHVFGPEGAVWPVPCAPAGPMCFGWLPGGRRLIVGQGDGGLSIWDIASGQRFVDLSGHRGYVRDVALSPDGRVLATAGAEGTVRLWRTD